MMVVNKIDRPNTTPTIRAICKFAVYFSVFRPFSRFSLVYEGHRRYCYCWFSHDVTKFQTSELLILLRFYFHDVQEQLKTNIHTKFRSE